VTDSLLPIFCGLSLLTACLLDTLVSPIKMDEPIEVWGVTAGLRKPCVTLGPKSSTGRCTLDHGDTGTCPGMPGGRYTKSESQGAASSDAACSLPLLWQPALFLAPSSSSFSSLQYLFLSTETVRISTFARRTDFLS